MITGTMPEKFSDLKRGGVKCPSCGCPSMPVVYTRHFLNITRRVRECRVCKTRVKCDETIVEVVR